MTQMFYYPIKNYGGLSPNYRGKRWAYVNLIRGAANHSIILYYEACKCAYLCMYSKWSIYEQKYEDKMHIKARKTIFLTLL